MKLFNYLVLIVLIFNGIVPIGNYLIFKEELSYCYMLSPVWTLNIAFIYPIIGYYLDNKIDLSNHKKRLIVLWIINILLIIITCIMTLYHSRIINILREDKSQLFYNSFVIINAITVFLTVKYLTTTNKINTFLAKTGKYTLGVYLFHYGLLKCPYFYEYLDKLKQIDLNSGLIAFIICFSIYLISFIATFILSKIPLIKKLVGF